MTQEKVNQLSFWKSVELYLLGVTVVDTPKGLEYFWKCKKHGIVSTFKIRGYEERLECPSCWEEVVKEKNK